MRRRLDKAVSRGCDGVEPDNVDGYTNHNGLGLTAADQLAYNKWLASGKGAILFGKHLKLDILDIFKASYHTCTYLRLDILDISICVRNIRSGTTNT